MISRKYKFRFREKRWISQESLRCSINKESGTNGGNLYHTDNCLAWCCSDSKSCKNGFRIWPYRYFIIHSDYQKTYSPLDKFIIPFPSYYFSVKLYSPLYQISFFLFPPKKSPPPHTHRKNDRSLEKNLSPSLRYNLVRSEGNSWSLISLKKK